MRGYFCVGLCGPKFSVNIASVLRASYVFGASMLAVTGSRYKKHGADTIKAYRHFPLVQVSDIHDIVPFDCVPVAVDLLDGATPLHEYSHPERAFYIFGPEDGTLGKSVLSWCRDRVYIPTKHCMNLAACVSVVLYDRMAKELRKGK